MREGVFARRGLGRAVLVLAIGAVAAACGADIVAPVTPPAGSASAQPAEGAAATPGASAPSPSDPVTGTFRRGGVPVPRDVLARAVTACKAAPTPSDAEVIGNRPVVVSDVRGEGVVIAVFAGADGATGCRVTLREVAADAALFAVETNADGPLDEGEITLGTYELDEDGSNERTIAVGQYGDRVVKVRAGFDDDTYVTSSTDNGWYAMWWQGSIRPAVIVAADNRNEALGKIAPPKGSPAP